MIARKPFSRPSLTFLGFLICLAIGTVMVLCVGAIVNFIMERV
jgi:hypothetical protein